MNVYSLRHEDSPKMDERNQVSIHSMNTYSLRLYSGRADQWQKSFNPLNEYVFIETEVTLRYKHLEKFQSTQWMCIHWDFCDLPYMYNVQCFNPLNECVFIETWK